MNNDQYIKASELTRIRRLWVRWTLLIVLEAGFCGALATVLTGFDPTGIGTTVSENLSWLWSFSIWFAAFIGCGILAFNLTLAVAGIYYALLDC